MDTEQYIQLLRLRVEDELGTPMRTPKDFDALSESIFQKVHLQLSSSTLKRIWGYLATASLPRQSSLDVLAQYVGYANFQAFCQSQESNVEGTDNESVVIPPPNPSDQGFPIQNIPWYNYRRPWIWLALLLLLIAGMVCFFFSHQSSEQAEQSQRNCQRLRHLLIS